MKAGHGLFHLPPGHQRVAEIVVEEQSFRLDRHRLAVGADGGLRVSELGVDLAEVVKHAAVAGVLRLHRFEQADRLSFTLGHGEQHSEGVLCLLAFKWIGCGGFSLQQGEQQRFRRPEMPLVQVVKGMAVGHRPSPPGGCVGGRSGRVHRPDTQKKSRVNALTRLRLQEQIA